MIKLLLVFAAATVLTACGNDGTTKTTASDTATAPNLTNVQNVNGNQPDTTTGIKLSTSGSPDTTKKPDTLPR